MISLVVLFALVLAVVCLVVALAPAPSPTTLELWRGRVRRSDRRGGLMDKIAGVVVMGLGHLTIATLHLFEKLGVNMTAFDEALSRLTTFTAGQAASLKEASTTIAEQAAEIRRLIDTDAAQDEIDLAEARATALDEAAAKVDAVVDNLENPPADEFPGQPPVTTDPGDVVVTEPGPPQTPPSGEFPTSDVPVVPSGDPANVPPESIPTPTPVEPVDPVVEEPVVEDPAPTEEPEDAEVVDLDADGNPVE